MKLKDFFKDAIFWAGIMIKDFDYLASSSKEELTPPSKRKKEEHTLSESEKGKRAKVKERGRSCCSQ